MCTVNSLNQKVGDFMVSHVMKGKTWGAQRGRNKLLEVRVLPCTCASAELPSSALKYLIAPGIWGCDFSPVISFSAAGYGRSSDVLQLSWLGHLPLK